MHNYKTIDINKAVRQLIIATAAAFTTTPAALAQCAANGWCKASETSTDTVYYRVTERKGGYSAGWTKYVSKTTGEAETYPAIYDCARARWQDFAQMTVRTKEWNDVLPGTAADSIMRGFCR